AFGCAAASVLTVQSTSGMESATAVPRAYLIAQCMTVLRDQNVRAFKVGALGSAENVRAVAGLLGKFNRVPAVIDPVILPSLARGRLLDPRALDPVKRYLIPRATLLTVNASEAESLTGRRVTHADEAEVAARDLIELGAGAVLVKGGHLRD